MRRRLLHWMRMRRLQRRLHRSGLTWLSPSGVARALGVGTVSLHEPFDLAERELDRQIDDLYRAGALDAGSADVVDELVRTWAVQQESALVAHQVERRALGGQLVTAAEMRLHAATQRSIRASEAVEEMRAARSVAHRRLTGGLLETTAVEGTT